MADVIVTGSGIYRIRNKKNGKCYVGSAVSFKTRWKRHRSELRAGTHHSEKLQRSWDKHGEEMFSFEVLEYVKDVSTLIDREQFWIDSLNAHKGGYNTCPNAGSVLGVKHSESMREKMREIRKNNPITPEHQEKMAEARRGSDKFMSHVQQLGLSMKGHRHTDEAKAKISEAGRIRMADPKVREAQRVRSTGFKHSAETIERLKTVPKRSGWSHTPEALEKIRQAGLGRKISPETIEKRKQTRKRNAELKKAQNESK